MASDWRDDLEIFVLSYNRGPHLEKCLQSVRDHAAGVAVAVVDDLSTDPRTQDVLRRCGCRVLSPAEKGKARLGGLWANMQMALLQSSRQLVLFLQDDSQFIRDLTSDDIQRLQQAFDADPRLAFVNPVLAMGPRGPRMRLAAQNLPGFPGRIFPGQPGKMNVVRAWYCDITLCHAQRLRAAQFTFGPTEEATARRAGQQFSFMLHYDTPFIAQMPEVMTLRFGSMTLAARLVHARLKAEVNTFLPIGHEEALRMRHAPTLPLAEDWLRTQAPTLRRPFVHKAVNAIFWIRALNKLEVKWRQFMR